MVLVALLVPFSAFISVPVNTPMTSVKEIIDDNVKTTQEWYEERAKTQYNLPFDDLEAEEQVDIIFQDSKWWMNSTLLTTPIVCGITTFLIAIFSYLVYIYKLRRRRLPAHESETAILRMLVQGERMPNLFRNGYAPTPMLVGIIRPTIYLPDIEYSDVQLYNILIHELTHLRRHDIIVKWITAFAVHIHWFNPIVYFVRREIDRACELACDEAVIKNLDDDGKQHYGDTLISVASDKRLPKTVLSTTMCEEKKALKERLGAIMKHKRFSIRAIVVSGILVITVLCGAIILSASAQRQNDLSKASDIVGKTYTYEKEGFGSNFTIQIKDDGTFNYYEGVLSSYIGKGKWILDGDILLISDDVQSEEYARENYFKVSGNDLVFISENSTNFLYLEVADGERFSGSPTDTNWYGINTNTQD
mgnify:CR=1 FL=1